MLGFLLEWLCTKKHVKNCMDNFSIGNFWSKHKVFFLLLLVGLAVRFAFIENTGLSNDELSAWFRTRFASWDEFWLLGVKDGDMHPGFYQVFLWIWVRVFGDSELSLRGTSLVFFAANLGLLYTIACRFFSRYTGLIIVAFYVSLSFLIINTTTARPYNSGVFFLLLAYYFLMLINTQEGKGKISSWIWLTVAFLGAMLSHYFAFLSVGIMGLLAIQYLSREKIVGLVVSGIGALVLFSLHASTTLHQLSKGGIGWLDKPDFFWWADFLKQTFQDSWWMLSIAIILIIFVKNNNINISKNQGFGLRIAIITGVAAYFISILYTPILRELVFQFLLPFILFGFLGSIQLSQDKGRWKKYLPFGIVTLFTLHSIFIVEIFQPKHYGVFKELGQNQNAWVAERKAKNITFAENFNNVDYINYYLDSAVTEEIVDWADPRAVYQLHKRAKDSKTAYFLYNWSNNYNSPMFLECIRRYYPRLANQKSYFNSGSYLFSKTFKDNAISKREITEVFEGGLIEGEEFFGEFKTKVGNIRGELRSKEYLLLESRASVSDIKTFYMVVTAERDGEFLQIDSIPVLYSAYNQIELSNEPGMNDYFMAFDLPKKLRSDDIIKIYCWNPEKGEIMINNMKLYAVKVGL
jgi:hypothetical protein